MVRKVQLENKVNVVCKVLWVQLVLQVNRQREEILDHLDLLEKLVPPV